MILEEKYNRDHFISFISDYIPNFDFDDREIKISEAKSSGIQKAYFLGESKELDLKIFEIKHTGTSKRRVGLTLEGFKIMKNSGAFRALMAFYSDQDDQWRFSLMTLTPKRTGNTKLVIESSSPKRFSFLLGPNSKTATPEKFLISKGPVSDFEDLQSRFSLEVVNKDFYNKISELFIKFVGGSIGKGKSETEYEPLLKLPSVQDKSQTSLEFAVRLIGRVIFCWFLREKQSENNSPLMPRSLLSFEAVKSNKEYYHSVLEPIFFEVLNKPIKERKEDFTQNGFHLIPYLNGGLFTPHDDDFFSYNEGKQAVFNNTVQIPDAWFQELFEFLETYNFTIDENISFDEELSIDPEMLGRIFENLLAEINPDTGESARKSTGSYYTPRTIVDYMVDESLYQYLKNKTSIDEEKLRAVISYDLMDDLEHPLDEQERKRVTDALNQIKILDPACGSGAFPMGMLQKIVFILQQTDPEGKNWFKKQIQDAAPEIQRVIEREFKNKHFDYIRKLGIIRENIFGVDIQPIATDISRLRCFLTLIVDESIDDDAENRGIEPLPNLDFKFVTANTLIGLPQSAKSQEQTNLFEDETGISELQELRDEFFNSTGTERESLKLKWLEIQNDMLTRQREHSFLSADLTNKLTNWKPFTHEPSPWFDPEWMFGIKDGFNIVIGNPPYIKENVNKKAFDGLRKEECYQGKMDLWYLFGCRGIDLLIEDGVLSFIAINNWTTNDGASKFRNKIVNDTQILSFIDFNDFKVFSAGVQTMIIVLKKSKMNDTYEVNYKKFLKSEINHLLLHELLYSDFKRANMIDVYKFNFSRLDYQNSYINFISPDIQKILIKMKTNGKLNIKRDEINSGIDVMQDFVTKKHIQKLGSKFKIGEGIYVLSDDELKKIKLTENEKKIIKPYYTTKEINRFSVNPKNEYWIIYSKNEINYQKEKYPNLTKHLENFKEIITSANKPYGLHRARKESIFLGEKILSQRKCAKPSFSFIDFPCYVARSFLIIKTNRINMKCLTVILNSEIIEFWLKYKGKMQGSNYQIDINPLTQIPIPELKLDQERKAISLSEKAQKAATKKERKNIERQVNKMVMDLFKLTDEEKETIEKFSSL